MLSREEIVTTLEPLNGDFFLINDLVAYADKVLANGRSLVRREPSTGTLMAYVLYYDNQPEILITMVWTAPDHRRRGLARDLVAELLAGAVKPVHLEVHHANPAVTLYRKLGFRVVSRKGDILTMKREPDASGERPALS